MSAPAPTPDDSRFRWTSGGWFGAQFGVSAWLLPLGVLVAKLDPKLGAIAGAGFVGLNGLGFGLYGQRETMSAYSAIQWLLAASTVVNSVVILFARKSEGLAKIANNRFVSGDVPLALIAVAPSLMLMFWLQERASKKPRS